MLQKALHRAVRVSHAARVLVTAAEVHRSHWQGALWCVPPGHRFVSASPGWSSLTTAAAVFWIAARAPSNLVAILPARCYVADECTLTVALHRALYEQPLAVDDVLTLGMVASAPVIDEDYLVLRESDGRPMGTISFSSLESKAWVAEELLWSGLVASRIYIGRAGTLAALFYEYWPALTHVLLRQLAGAGDRDDEIRVPPSLTAEALRAAPRSYWDRPPWVPQRVFRVKPCGWSGLRSRRAIERIPFFQAGSSDSIAEGMPLTKTWRAEDEGR
jgi:hypothetical protein